MSDFLGPGIALRSSASDTTQMRAAEIAESRAPGRPRGTRSCCHRFPLARLIEPRAR